MTDNTLKTYTCRLKHDVIQKIKQLALDTNVSQSVVLENAMACITDSHTFDRQNVKQNMGEVQSLFVEELRHKNQQIENLQNIINQQNHLLLLRFQKSGMQIEDKSDSKQTKGTDQKKPKKGKNSKKK